MNDDEESNTQRKQPPKRSLIKIFNYGTRQSKQNLWFILIIEDNLT